MQSDPRKSEDPPYSQISPLRGFHQTDQVLGSSPNSPFKPCYMQVYNVTLTSIDTRICSRVPNFEAKTIEAIDHELTFKVEIVADPSKHH